MRPVLVTRAEPGATRSCARLADMGYDPINAATARIRFLDPPLDLEPGETLALTSPNGALAAARLTNLRSLPVFTVGEATARAALGEGFSNVTSAAGVGAALASLILRDGADRIVHIHGRDQSFDLAGALVEAGRGARGVVAYAAEAVDHLPPPALEALSAGAGVVIHSPKGAERFVSLVRHAGCESVLAGTAFAAISEAAAAPLRRAGAQSVTIAQTPDEDALFKALAQALH
jgi:uroporphyrinogen-III synthase